jgi:branched-chain amino acid transport system substrate-binding protein
MFRLNMMAYSVAIVAALAAANNAAADTVVTIGEVSPLTGSIAHLGKDIANGAQLAVDEINATELMIGGQKVTLKLDTEDDAGDPRQATQVAQKLVDEKVVAVVGHMTSGTSIPASKIYSDAGIAQVTPSATNPAYTQQGFKTTFRLVATDAQQGPALAEYASKKLKIKTVAIVDDSTAYGQGLAEQFSKSATAFGVNVVSRDATNDKAVDFRSILTKIKGERPDAIMFGGSDASAGPFAKQARALGIKAIILGGDGICSEQVASLAGDAASSIVCSEASMALQKMPGGAAFTTKYAKAFNTQTQIYAPFGYDAVYVIADAMKRADSTSPAKIVEALPKANYQGVTGKISFAPSGDLQHGTISFFSYKDGKKTFVDDIRL